MSITAEYRNSMNEAAREALRSLIADQPRTSVADLRELVAEHSHLGEVTLAELFGHKAPAAKPARQASQRRAPKAAATKSTTAKSTPAKPGAPSSKPATRKRGGKREDWNTNTAEGRTALDRAVIESLAAFGGVSVSAEALRARLGATPAQLRASLSRHIEAGDVTCTGKARGTRYSLEG